MSKHSFSVKDTYCFKNTLRGVPNCKEERERESDVEKEMNHDERILD